MSTTRMGRVKRAVLAAFEAEPDRRFTTAELAAVAYGAPVADWHLASMRRLLPTLGLASCRVATPGRFGWHKVWGRDR